MMAVSWSQLAAVSFGIQWVGFGLASAMKTEKFYDLFGSLTFLAVTGLSLGLGRNIKSGGLLASLSRRQLIQSGMAASWALRLGSYLFMRILKDGEDRRFREIKESMPRFFVAWTMQGIWVLMSLLPTLMRNAQQEENAVSSPRDYLGWSLWLVGMLIEVVADRQKAEFRADPLNAGRFISSGLWAYSRHPNYLGEIILWSGLALSSSASLNGDAASIVGCLASPAFVTFLLTRVSGIPLLEKSAQRRWGHEAAYQRYVSNTAVLVPGLW